MMIEIAKLEMSAIEQVKNILLDEEQIKFACTAEEFLLDGSDTTHLHTIKLNGDVVGFLKLDIAYSSFSFCPEGGIGLRSFAIDKNYQGKGLGTQAIKALPSYIKKHYPNISAIYLTVNCNNIGAKACYRKCGFDCLTEKYLGGEAGPQYIMRRKIE